MTKWRHCADDIFKYIFLNENIWIPIEISLKFGTKGTINNIPVLVQIMTCRRPGDKPLSEPMIVRLPTHICVTRPQWVKIQTERTHSIYKLCVRIGRYFTTNIHEMQNKYNYWHLTIDFVHISLHNIVCIQNRVRCCVVQMLSNIIF